MSVVGVDFGNANCVIAVARRQGIDVIANEVSNRETPSFVSFGPKERHLGEAGLNQEVMNFKNTISNLKNMIGRKWDDKDLQEELKAMNIKAKPTQNNEWAVEVLYRNEVHSFTPERLIGMLFGKLKKITETELKNSVCDCVLSVPGYFTDQQRKALYSAAKIGGWNPLRLMNELTATALSYSIFKTDLAEDNPINVMFVDFGQSNLSVGIFAITKSKLRTLATAYERFGGRDYDNFLCNHFANIFKTKPGIDVNSNPRAKLRLRLACEKLKKVLSANAEGVLNIECLMDDKDVRALLKRDEFFELTKELSQRLTHPVQRALQEAGITSEQLHSVEIVGGSSRMPLFQRTLSEFLKRDLSKTINSSEGVSRGCALQCAIISPTFRVRDFSVEDTSLYPIGLTWRALGVGTSKSSDEMDVDNTGTEGKLDLFVHNNPIPSVKQASFVNKKDGMELNLQYLPSPFLPEGTPTLLGKYIIPPLKPRGEEVPKIQLRVKLNIHGVVEIESLQALETIEEEVEIVEEKKVPASGAAGAAGATAPAATSGEPAAPATGAEGEQKQEPPKEAPMEVVKEKRVEKRKKVLKTDLQYQPPSLISSLSPQELAQFIEDEAKMRAADKLTEETSDRKNAFESYILNMRNRVGGDLYDYVQEGERADFLQKLQEGEDWLYTEEGDDAPKSAYVERLVGLQKIGFDFETRKKEYEGTKEAFDEIKALIAQFRASVTLEKFNHIEKAEKDKVLEKCNEVEQQIEALEAKKAAHPKNQKPIVLTADVNAKKKELEKFGNDILNKPKPIPKPEEKSKEQEKKQKEPEQKDQKDQKEQKEPEGQEGKQNMDVEK